MPPAMGSCIEVWRPFCSAVVGHAWEGGRTLGYTMCLPYLGLPCPTSAVQSEQPSSTTDFWPQTRCLTPAGGGKLWKALEWWATTIRLSLLSVVSLRHNASKHKGMQNDFFKNYFKIKFNWMFIVFNCVCGGRGYVHMASKSVRSLARVLAELRSSALSHWVTAPAHQRNH